jgi:uncharacterized protein
MAREPGVEVVLVARREARLRALASALGERASWIAADLVDAQAPERIRAHVQQHHGRLDLLVNNAGTSLRASFAQGGYENVRRTMSINFDAHLRLTEALLSMLRTSAPSAIVNVASVAARFAVPGAGAYAASKAALAAWSDALWFEERPHGVHVGLVMPGAVPTEGFPQEEFLAKRLTRWTLSTPEKVAEGIYQAGAGRRPERYAPRLYGLQAALRILSPGLARRIVSAATART